MGQTIVRPVCAIAAMCMLQDSIPDRYTGMFRTAHTIVTNTSYQLELTFGSLNSAPTTLQTRLAGTDHPFYSCSTLPPAFTSCMVNESSDQQFDQPMNFTTGEAQTQLVYVTTGAITRWTFPIVAPTPSQPSFRYVKLDDGNASYELRTSEFSEVYGSGNLSACLLASAPSSADYDAWDLPGSWPRDNSSYVFTSEDPSVQARIWLNPAENMTVSEPWVNSTALYDYYFVCYNDAGASSSRAIRNLRTVREVPSAPTIDSISILEVDRGSYMTTVSFQTVQNISEIGVYPAGALWCDVCLGECLPTNSAGIVHNEFAYNSAAEIVVWHETDFEQHPMIPINVRCSTSYNAETFSSLLATAAVYQPVRRPNLLCDVGRCLYEAYRRSEDFISTIVSGSNVTIQSRGEAPGQLITYTVFDSENSLLADLGNCTNNNDPSSIQTCNSTVLDTAQFEIGMTVRFCHHLMRGSDEIRRCISYTIVAPVPSPSMINLELSSLQDVGQEDRLTAVVVGQISTFSSEYGAQIDGCCFFYGESPIDMPVYNNLTEALNSSIAHTCVASPMQGSVINMNPEDIIANTSAGANLDVHHVCYNQFGQSVVSSVFGQLWTEALPLPPSIELLFFPQSLSEWSEFVLIPGNTRQYVNSDIMDSFIQCWMQVMPAGVNVSDAEVFTVTDAQPQQRYDTELLLNWQESPSFDIYSQCITGVGASEVAKMTLTLPFYVDVECESEAMCPLVSSWSSHGVFDRALRSVVQGFQLNLTAHRSVDGIDGNITFIFQETVIGECTSVDGVCSVMVLVNFTSSIGSTISINVADIANDIFYDFTFLAVSTTPSQPQMSVSLDSPSGVNSTIMLTASLYASEYSTDGSTNMTECLLVWTDDQESGQSVSDFRSLNSSYSYSFVPSYQGQQVTLNFSELLPANLSGKVVYYDFQCYNSIDSSMQVKLFDLIAVPSLPSPLVAATVSIESFLQFLVIMNAPLSSEVGFVDGENPRYLQVKVFFGYANFSLDRGEYNYSITLNYVRAGYEQPLYVQNEGSEDFDFSWSTDWDFHFVVVNPVGESNYYMSSAHFDFTIEGEFTSPMYISFEGTEAYTTYEEIDSCRTCGVYLDSYDAPQKYWPVLQSMTELYIRVDGWYHQHISVVLLINETYNATLTDRFVNPQGQFYLDLTESLNFSNAAVGTQYIIVASSSGSMNSNTSESSSITLRVTAAGPVPAQSIMAYVGPNSELSPDDQQDVGTLGPIMLMQIRDYGDLECMLVWGSSSTLYEANDVPLFFNRSFIDARQTNGTGLYFFADEDLQDNSDFGYMLDLNRLSNSTEPQDYHFMCYNELGHSTKISSYNLISHASQGGAVQELFAVAAADLLSVNVTMLLPAHTGDMGVFGVGSTVTFTSCSFEWYVNNSMVGAVNITDSDELLVSAQVNFVVSDLDLFTYPTIVFVTQCFGDMTGAGVSSNFTYTWQNPFSYSDDVLVTVEPVNAVIPLTQWSNFSNDASTVVLTIIEGTSINISASYQGRSDLMLVDLANNRAVISTCNTGLAGTCDFVDVVMPAAGSLLAVEFDNVTVSTMSYLSVTAVPAQPPMNLINSTLFVSTSDSSVTGCVLSAGPAASSFAGQTGLTYASVVDLNSTVFFLGQDEVVQSSEITQQDLVEAGLMSGETYHVYWVCYNNVGASAPAAVFSLRVFYEPVISSSSSSSSSSTGADSSATGGVDSSAFTSTDQSSSSSSSTAPSSSSSVMQNSSSSSYSSSSSSSSMQVSSSSAVVPSPAVPAGTVKVVFSVSIPNGEITITFITALTNDILSTIAQMFGLPIELMRPFVKISIGSTNSRRLLQQSVPVSFTLLGNVSTVTGNATTTNPNMTVDATSIATSVTGAIATGTLVNTESAALGMVVPTQTVVVEAVVTPTESSSTGGVDDNIDSPSSSISSGAIAGAVIGAIVGVALLFAVALAVHTGACASMFSRSPAVAQMNANDFKPRMSKVGSERTSVEMV